MRMRPIRRSPEYANARPRRGRALLRQPVAAGSGKGSHVLRLNALGPPRLVELDLLPLGQGAETVRLDGSVVVDDVVAAIGLRDEAEALRIVESLHGTSRHLGDALFFAFTPGKKCLAFLNHCQRQ